MEWKKKSREAWEPREDFQGQGCKHLCQMLLTSEGRWGFEGSMSSGGSWGSCCAVLGGAVGSESLMGVDARETGKEQVETVNI